MIGCRAALLALLALFVLAARSGSPDAIIITGSCAAIMLKLVVSRGSAEELER